MLNNLVAEQIILGAILNNNDLYNHTLKAADFHEPIHKEIYTKLAAEISAGSDANPVLLHRHFPEPRNYLITLTAKASGAVNINSYLNEVKELSAKRKLKALMSIKIEELQKPGADSKVLLEDFHKQVAEIHANTSEYRLVSYQSVLKEIYTDTQEYGQEKVTTTGLNRIDKSMGGGLKPGKSYCIAARPKDGKTMIKGTIANHLRKQQVPFLFIAAEMGKKEIAKRLIGQDLDIPFSSMNRGSEKFIKHICNETQQDGKMFFIDSPRISLEALKLTVANAVRTKKIEGFVLDYLQLVSGKDPRESIAQHQENVAQTIAEICKKEAIWCLYSCQINREGEIRNGDGILMAIDWLYEICATDYLSGEDAIKRVYLKHIATRNSSAADIGATGYEAFEMSKNGTHFKQLEG